MSDSSRRAFLKQTSLAAAGAAAVQLAGPRVARAAADKFLVGVIGCGGRGTYLAETFAANDDVTIGYLCDPDPERATRAGEQVMKRAKAAPAIVTDLRKVIDDPSINAVVIATPDHWHAPAAIMALNAGKHVYVEKPCSHNIREGRLLVEAARKNKRICQVGTQSRTASHIESAVQMLRSGVIGDVLVAKAWNSQKRKNIGHQGPGEKPQNLDYDMWVGPAAMVPYQANRLHYNWHWWYDFGTGDMGNDGVHDIDIARWGLGVEEHPTAISAIGGKYFFDDDQQFPDTQYVSFEYPGNGKTGSQRQLIFESRIWSPYVQEGYENGNAFYGTEGMMILGKAGGWEVYGPGNKLIQKMRAAERGPAHIRNFLDCAKQGREPTADVEIGHLSATLCHLGNIATRVGRVVRFDSKTEQIRDDPEAAKLLRRDYREGHWAMPVGV